MNGVVILAYMLGIAASSFVYDLDGYYLSCGVILVCNLLAILHLVFFVKDVGCPPSRDDEESPGGLLEQFLWSPLRDFFGTLTKRRPGRYRTYLYVLLVIYAIYYGTNSSDENLYLYMTLVR